ncbi:hypothetical protein [Clostridium vincentii]|uniref:Lipoprotein n=1 Tax=Clostridium vincentii TaxID=52704 RepID=A0A2T0BGA4_9CLOT|nr:hypothetical protein [Clostridium vincentii]PRR82941.1 hypothetical protein CLVI_13840 [Clostridium vincentii]
MKRHKKAKYIVFGIVFSSLLLNSCGINEEAKIEGVKLNKGAIIQNDDGYYKNYNLQDGKYNQIDSEETIRLYDNIDGNYISEKDGKYFSFYNGKIEELKSIGSGDSNLKLSPNGKFISYFKNDDEVNSIKIMDLNSNSPVEFNSTVHISGSYLEWIDESHIVYYGIKEEHINGIFIYDVKNKSEKLFYELEEGFIQFLKSVDTGLICVQQTLDNKRLIRLIDKDGTYKCILSEAFLSVKDVIYNGEDYYVIGTTSNNIPSIYKLKDGKNKRMIFDFPIEVNMNKGLSVDEEGNILFIGKSSSSRSDELYTLKKDGLIKQIKSDSIEYNFVEYQ